MMKKLMKVLALMMAAMMLLGSAAMAETDLEYVGGQYYVRPFGAKIEVTGSKAEELQKKGVPFAAGVLMPNDVDVSVASALAGRLICSEPFMPADDAQREEAERLIGASEFVIVCGCPVGEFNRVNGLLEQYAVNAGKKIVRSLAELKEVLS